MLLKRLLSRAALVSIIGATAAPALADDGPGSISGVASDAAGKPLEDVLVWAQPASVGGLHQTRTEADGSYTLDGLMNLGHRVRAWVELDYRGRHYCLRLGMPAKKDYFPASPAKGLTRNFRLQTAGRIPDVTWTTGDGAFFGATVRVHRRMLAGSLELELRPTGALIDGSPGQAVVRTMAITQGQAEVDFLDVPVGPYVARVTHIAPDGARRPLRIGPNLDPAKTEAAIEFPPAGDSCGGSDGSGVGRAYLFTAD
jgi:hypothetical protein